MKEWFLKLRQYLLSGVSFAIPFIACGGIMIATAIAFAPLIPGKGPDFSHSPTLKLILDIGVASFQLMPSVLAGYIAYAMAGKPGLVPGMVGGWLATHMGVFMEKTTHELLASPTANTQEATAGFLGAMLAGLIAGYIVMAMKKIPAHKYIKPIMPVLVIPIVSSSIVGYLMLYPVGRPIAHAMAFMGQALDQMNAGHWGLVLAALLGAMIAFDMGGPINKAAFFFGAGLVADQHYSIMGCIAAAICVPPLGMGLATMINRKIWTEEQRESGIASLAMGMIGITEGAIPFAASDPLRVIPCICVGSALAAVIAMAGGVGDHAPHGGPIVLPVIDHKLMYVIAIVSGTVFTAISVNILMVMTNRPHALEESSEASMTVA